jgi:hypothetical protein
MSVLSVLSGLATVAGKGLEGYDIQERTKVAQALAQQKAAEEAQRNAVLNRVSMAGIDPSTQGAIEGARANARVPAAISQAQGLAPIKVKEAVDTAAGVAPIQQGTHLTNRKADVANPLPVPPSFTPVVTTAPGGAQQVQPFDTKHGTMKPPVATAKAASGGIGARGFGAGGIFGGASGLGSIKEMDAANPRMKHFEAGLMSEAPGAPTLKMFDNYRMGILNAARHAGQNFGDIAGAISSFVSSGAAEEMARQNPQLGTYARELAQWIVADLNLTRNASDERGRMDQIASSALALPLSDMPFANRREYIHGIWEGRDGRLSGLHKVVPAAESMLEQLGHRPGMSAPTAAPTAAAVTGDPEFDALMAKHRKP